MTRITICLTDTERKALRTLAEKEFREPRAQAALIIHHELERCGLLPPGNPINPPSSSELLAEPIN
jgi:hypothetical protein